MSDNESIQSESIRNEYSFKYIMSLNPDDIEGDITETISTDTMSEKMNKVEFQKFFRKFYDYFNSFEIDKMEYENDVFKDIIKTETNKIKIERLIQNPREETIKLIQLIQIQSDENELDIDFMFLMLKSDFKNYINKLFEIFDFDDIIYFYKKIMSYCEQIDCDEYYSVYFTKKIEKKIIEIINSGEISIYYTDELIIEFINDVMSDYMFKKMIDNIIFSNVEFCRLVEKLSNSKLIILFEVLNKHDNKTVELIQYDSESFFEFIKKVNIDVLDMFYINYKIPIKIDILNEILDKVYDDYEKSEYFINMGADINFRNSDGSTPFMKMCKVHNEQNIMRLLKKGPILHYFDTNNNMILDYVKENSYDIADIIINEIDYFSDYKDGYQIYIRHEQWLKLNQLRSVMTKTIIKQNQLNELIRIREMDYDRFDYTKDTKLIKQIIDKEKLTLMKSFVIDEYSD